MSSLQVLFAINLVVTRRMLDFCYFSISSPPSPSPPSSRSWQLQCHCIILLAALCLYRKQLRYVNVVIKSSWKHQSPVDCWLSQQTSKMLPSHALPVGFGRTQCWRRLIIMLIMWSSEYLLRVIKVRQWTQITWQCLTNCLLWLTP